MMKILKFTFLLLILLFAQTAQAQSSHKNLRKAKSQPTSIREKVIRKRQIISGGVVNGNAIDLVVPEYPSPARAMNTHGTVRVNVLIDEKGDVVEAKAYSGNYILRASAVSAALKSKFEFVKIGDVPVRVRGTICYNFSTGKYNWLEIGHAFGDKVFAERLPSDFGEEKQFYEQYETADETSKVMILQNLRASIENKLGNERKKLWLFQVGIVLNEIETKCCRYDDLTEKIIELKSLLSNSPEKVSPALISKLENIAMLSENPQNNNYKPNEGSMIYTRLFDIHEQVSDLGN